MGAHVCTSICTGICTFSRVTPSPPPGIDVWNPAFDVTPHELITGGIVTEFGVFRPEELRHALGGR